VVVTGGATGVGAALLDLLAQLGEPDVTVLDIKPPTGPHRTFLETDLSDSQAIDAAIAKIEGPVDALFNNAGVADTFPQEVVVRVNILAPIRLTNALLPQIPEGGAVVTTASIAGSGWPQRAAMHKELLELEEWGRMDAWFAGKELGIDTYSFTKETMQVWTMRAAGPFRKKGVRINSICPAPIDTPLMADFRKTIGDANLDFAVQYSGGRMLSGREVAQPLAWLASPSAACISGQNLCVDWGLIASINTGTL
jgi:NAD(P)-dependent dehydrogenase (short-subunit alcohol dehydrogenase family)